METLCHKQLRFGSLFSKEVIADPTHGQQQLSFFHGYYEEHMYHPLLAFDGRTGFPLAAVLRPGNAHASKGALAVLKRCCKC